jgi:hypothetical protein
MNDTNYEDEQPEGEEPQEPSSLEGKGWDILAGGKENPFAMGGDDPFDLRSPENPNPYTDDEEADWVLTSPATPEAASPSSTPPDEETGPVTAPSYMFPGGAQMPPGGSIDALPGEYADTAPGVSPGVTVTPVGEAGEPPILPPSEVAPPSPFGAVSGEPDMFTSVTDAAPVEQPPAGQRGLSPGVSVTPLGPDGEPLPGEPDEYTTPLGGDKEGPYYAPPVVPALSDETEPPAGGPIPMPDDFGPLVLPPSTPPIPDTPPYPIPQPVGLSQGGLVSDPFPGYISRTFTTKAEDELEPDIELRTMLITPERVNALWDEIDETFNLIITDVRGHYETTEQAITDLKRAREYLLAGTQYFDNAEVLVKGVKARLRLEEKVRQWSKTRGTWLGVYLVVWLILLSLGSLLTNEVMRVTARFVPEWLASTWLPGLFGGLGGVAGALWILIKHTAVKRDFDPIHTPWYVINPFMGITMGVVTYFVVMVGSTTLFNIADVNAELDFTSNSLANFLYLLCIVVGFNQNVLWSLIDRVIDTIFPQPLRDTAADREIEPQGPIAGEGLDTTTFSGPKG